jgi:ADP-ribose pyrophosphatase YjhB (NUDIX family)
VVAKTKFDISAGGVVYTMESGKVMVCVIKTSPQGYWQLPKGLVDKGESLEEAAVREVREETGLEGKLEGLIDKIEYWFWLEEEGKKVRHHKMVYFYLMKYVKGSPQDHDQEVDEARWFSCEEALGKVSFKSEKEIVQKARMMLHERQTL